MTYLWKFLCELTVPLSISLWEQDSVLSKWVAGRGNHREMEERQGLKDWVRSWDSTEKACRRPAGIRVHVKSKVNPGNRRFANVEEGDYQNFEFIRAWQLGKEDIVTVSERTWQSRRAGCLRSQNQDSRPEGEVFQCSQESWSWLGLNQVKTE